MERQRIVNLPLAGKVSHGIKQANGTPKDLGYFFAKSNDSQMDLLVEKFKKVYGEKPDKIKVKFFDENPFTVKNVRYNQSGVVCYCLDGKRIAKEKVKNIWQDKECLPNCEYAVSENGGKPSCIQEGTLKFLLPEISVDRIWLMKTRGVTIINKISSYIESQKALGNSVKGEFYIYLTKEKQTRKADGKTFTNNTIGIMRVDDCKENEAVKSKETEKISTESEKIVEKNTSKTKKSSTNKIEKKQEIKPKEENTNVVQIPQQTNSQSEIAKEGEYDINKCYSFYSLSPISIKDKNGKERVYTLGQFFSLNDEEVSAILKPDLAEELKLCDLGTVLALEMIDSAGKKWVSNAKFIQKCTKKMVV